MKNWIHIQKRVKYLPFNVGVEFQTLKIYIYVYVYVSVGQKNIVCFPSYSVKLVYRHL